MGRKAKQGDCQRGRDDRDQDRRQARPPAWDQDQDRHRDRGHGQGRQVRRPALADEFQSARNDPRDGQFEAEELADLPRDVNDRKRIRRTGLAPR